MTAPAANPGTLARSRSAHGRRPGTRTSAVGKHHERIGKDVGRARIGPTDENWAGGVIPCDVVPVVREHANRHEGSEFASPSPQRWLGPGDRRRGTRIGPTTRPTPKSALLDARLHFGFSKEKRNDCTQVVSGLVVDPEGIPLGTPEERGLVAALFDALRVQRTSDGGVRIEAQPEAASSLVALFEGLARIMSQVKSQADEG